MSSQNQKIFGLYTPFRNYLRNLDVVESLYVLWAFSRNLSFNYPLPDDIEVPSGFVFHEDITKRRYRGMPEQEIEFLVKEVILNANLKIGRSSIKNRKTLSRVVNYLRFNLKEEISKLTSPEKPEDFLFEFNRMAHNQFNWQLGHHNNILFRYYKIYSSPEVESLLKKKLDLTVYQVFMIGIVMYVISGRQFKIDYPYKSYVDVISSQMIEKFFAHFSMTLEEAKNEMKNSQQMNENLMYAYNPLRARPILVNDGKFFCPIPLLIFWQITSGLYYFIVGEDTFQNAFGSSFEKYVGEVITKTIKNKDITFYSEHLYGNGKKTTDWILTDSGSILFIECKAKRMTMTSKTDSDVKAGLVKDIKHMARFITQLYKTFLDFKENKYSHLKYDQTKNFIPLVLTLENWYVHFNPRIMSLINEYVLQEFENSGLEVSLLEEYPYYISSMDDFENNIQVINEIGVTDYFKKYKRNELSDFLKNFKFDVVFGDEFKSSFLEPLKL